jgi:hypothetical protein
MMILSFMPSFFQTIGANPYHYASMLDAHVSLPLFDMHAESLKRGWPFRQFDINVTAVLHA